MPTEVIIAIAVESAPTSTEVRRKDPAMLREASIASTPTILRSIAELTDVSQQTSTGVTRAEAAISRSADRYPKIGLPEMAGTRAAVPAEAAKISAIIPSRVRETRMSYP